MATNFIKVLQEIRGTGAPEAPYTNGIFYNLTIEPHDGNPGIYGDILYKYAQIAASSSNVYTWHNAVEVMHAEVDEWRGTTETFKNEAQAARDQTVAIATNYNFPPMDRLAVQALDNIASVTASVSSLYTQPSPVAAEKLIWEIVGQSSNTDMISFNELTSEFTIYIPGTFNFRTRIKHTSASVNTILATVRIVDVYDNMAWHTDDTTVPSLTTVENHTNKTIETTAAGLPKTFRIEHFADGVGVNLESSDFLLSSFSVSRHNSLLGNDDPDCHPISAITGLTGVIAGNSISGEQI